MLAEALLIVFAQFEPTAYITGGLSEIRRFEVRRITTQAQLSSLWAQHHGKEIHQIPTDRIPIANVNFYTYEVLAIFLGESIDSDSLMSIKVIRFRSSTTLVYSKSPWSCLDPFVTKSPFAFIILEKVSGPIRIVEQTSTDLPGQGYTYKIRDILMLPK